MKIRLVTLLPLSLAILQSLTIACGTQPGVVILAPRSEDSSEIKSSKNLVQTLQGDGRFSILVTAVKAAGLVEVLGGSSTYTVFAPSNKAFEALPAGTLDSLLKPENKEKLKAILLYHVAAGELKAADVLKEKTITTAQGKPVSVNAAGVKINNSGIVKTDILADNGIIHEIDAVLLPPDEKSGDSIAADEAMMKPAVAAPKSLAAALEAEPRFSILLAAVKAAGLAETLSGSGSFTVFAPSNKAFEALPAGTVESLLKPENKEKLRSVLLYHVAAGSLKAADVLSKSSIVTVQGKPVSINASTVKVNNASIIKTDIAAGNGIIHEIDSVLLPPADTCEKMISSAH